MQAGCVYLLKSSNEKKFTFEMYIVNHAAARRKNDIRQADCFVKRLNSR